MFGSWLLRGPFSRGSEWRLLSDRGVRASHCGASPVAERRPSGAWTSVVAACRLSSRGSRALEHRLCRCDSWASLFRDLWDHPSAGIEPVSPAWRVGSSPPGHRGSLTRCRSFSVSLMAFLPWWLHAQACSPLSRLNSSVLLI